MSVSWTQLARDVLEISGGIPVRDGLQGGLSGEGEVMSRGPLLFRQAMHPMISFFSETRSPPFSLVSVAFIYVVDFLSPLALVFVQTKSVYAV
jgi:hypothetical protein